MAEYVSNYKKRLMNEGNDQIELPTYCMNTLVPCFWKDKVINGKKYSIIHPDIKSLIINKISKGELSWEYLLQDNFFVVASQLSTPVSVVKKVIEHCCLSNMTLKPNEHLLEERRIWYKQQVHHNHLQIDLSTIDLLVEINTHAMEYDDCPCLTCYQKNHPELEKKRCWLNTCSFLQAAYDIQYPTYEEINDWKEQSVLNKILKHEENLLFSQTTIPICDQAITEAEEIIENCSQLNNDILIRLFVLIRGMSEYEDDEERELNIQQLIKAYHHGNKEKQKQLQEFIHEKQSEILHVHSNKQPQRAASSSIHQKRRMIQNALDMNDITSSEDEDLVLSSSSEDQIDIPLKKTKSSQPALKDSCFFHCTVEGCSFSHFLEKEVIKHMKYHEKQQRFKCPYEGCSYSSNRSGNLKRHIRTHTGEKPFQCPYEGCNYSCNQSDSLKNHILTHTGEKPFKCHYEGCCYATTTSGHLKNHILTHTGEKPFKCHYEGCSFATTTSGHLKRHILIHTGEKPFKCPYEGCNYSCNQSGNLKSHIKSHHSSHVSL